MTPDARQNPGATKIPLPLRAGDKKSFKDESSTSAQILFWGAIHAQSKEKQTFMSQNKVTPIDEGPH